MSYSDGVQGRMDRRLLMSSGLHPLSTRWAFDDSLQIQTVLSLHVHICVRLYTLLCLRIHIRPYIHTYLHTYNMHATLHTCMHAWEVVFRRAYSCVIGAYIRRYSIGTHMYRYMIHVYTVLRFDEVRLCIAAPFSTESCSCYSASAFQWVPKSPCRWC